MTSWQKTDVRDALAQQLAEQVAVLEKAVANAVEGTTHAESKQEDKHDTRAIEAGYLAGAQTERLKLARQRLLAVQNMTLEDREHDGPIAAFDLVGVQRPDGVVLWHLLLPQVEGTSVEVAGDTVRIITPQSQLGEQLLDLYCGDELDESRPQLGRVAQIR